MGVVQYELAMVVFRGIGGVVVVSQLLLLGNCNPVAGRVFLVSVIP